MAFKTIKLARGLRHGLTLLELIIVLVILVVVAGLAVPTIQRSFAARKVAKAADLVRAELNRARIKALRTGKIHGFFYYPESGAFKIAPFNEEMVNVLSEARRRRDDVSTSNFDFGGDKLPSGIVFSDGETMEDARSVAAVEQNSSSTSGMRPVLFYPDGSSQSARIFLRSDQDDIVEIKLRGLTGTSASRPIVDSGSGIR